MKKAPLAAKRHYATPLLALALFMLPATGAFAQSTAGQSDIGYLTTSGCPSGMTVCFVQYGATVPVSGTLTPSGTQDVNQKQVNGATINVGVGAAGTGTQRVTTSTDSTIGTVTTVTSATVVQPTGTNLHAVLDTTSTTAVTQATAANLNATVVGTGTFAVQSTVSPAARTLVTLDVKTVTTGGTAVTALTAGHRTAGGFFQNPKGATIDLCINEIGTATGTTSSGDTTCIPPGGSYNVAPASTAVSVITSDSAHPFSGYGMN